MPESAPRTSILLIHAGLAACLLGLTLVRVHDLDFGFYLAHGRYITAHGVPDTEFTLPLLEGREWSSFWALGALLLWGAWSLLGATGLTLLCVAGYGGAFWLAAAAARHRGVPAWLAAVISGLAAAAVSGRFVERPGLVSALLLGMVVYAFSSGRFRERLRDGSVGLGTAAVAVSVAWSWTHAEWYIGVYAFVLGLASVAMPCRRRILLAGAVIVIPLATHLLLHPSGLKPILSPLWIPLGGSAKFRISEYTLESWRLMPVALVFVAGVVVAAAWLWMRRRRAESFLAWTLVILCLKVPRAVLPTVLVGVPYLAEWISTARIQLPKTLPVWTSAVLAVFLAAVGVATTALTPLRTFGFGVEPILDVRGVGEFFDSLPPREGVVLAEFGWTSLLLSQPGVVRQGVVMDGRQEAYPIPYYETVYQPLLRIDDEWSTRAQRHEVGFYFEPWSGLENSPRRMNAVRAQGWVLVSWDNAGRLAARPDLAERLRLSVLEFDPDSLEGIAGNPALLASARREIGRRCEWLEERGYSSQRGRIVYAWVCVRLGDLTEAVASLESARTQGAERFSRYWIVLGESAIARGDWETASRAANEVEERGEPATAYALRAEAALRRGDQTGAVRFLQRALEATLDPAQAARYRDWIERLRGEEKNTD